MSKQPLLVFSLLLAGLLVAFNQNRTLPANDQSTDRRAVWLKKKQVVQCSPDWGSLNTDSLANSMVILPGWGSYQWNIRSASDSARLYFQQGINMYYSFHIIEAMASFKKAEQFDAENPMIFWAQALAYGPNINDYASAVPPEAYTVAEKAGALAATCTPKEKALITAMSTRYSLDTSADRSSLNQHYTEAMAAAYGNFQQDADIAALYADAMMLEHPWQYWKHNGEAHPWTPKLLRVLEAALKLSPNHPGANHYYIHSTEASLNPKRALASANRLAMLMPSVSRMVHMPSHIYIRSGLYEQGIKVNEMSMQGYAAYSSLYPAVKNNAPLYSIHNLHMQTACAMLGAGYEASAAAATACRASFDSSFMSMAAPFGTFVQYVYMTPMFNDVRFGKWTDILTAAPVSPAYVYGDLLSHWAKGMAHARLKELVQARRELIYVQEHMTNGDMSVVMQPFNAPADAAKIAASMLAGIIAEEAGDLPLAVEALTRAVKYEDALIYNEPKDWLLPVRPYLGAVLLKAHQYAAAEKIFREDLKDNPANHWGLSGLYSALEKQNSKQALAVKKRRDSSAIKTGMNELPVVY